MSEPKPGMIAAGLLAVGTAVGIVVAHVLPPRPRRFAEPDPDRHPPELLIEATAASWLPAFRVAVDDFRALGFQLERPLVAPLDVPLFDRAHRPKQDVFLVTLRGQDHDDDHVGTCWTYTARTASERGGPWVHSAHIEVPAIADPTDPAAATRNIAIARHLLCHAFGFGPRHVKRTGHWFSSSTPKLGNDNRGIRPWIRARSEFD